MSEDFFNIINSVDPDEKPHYVAFHLGLHGCKSTPYLGVSRVQRVKYIYRPEFRCCLHKIFLNLVEDS